MALVRFVRKCGLAGSAARYWDRQFQVAEPPKPSGWLEMELIEKEYIRPQVSGDREVYYLTYFANTRLGHIPVKRVLSLGCGGGNLERALASMGVSQRIDGIDISKESIQYSRERAKTEGLDDRLVYGVQDINSIKLPERFYDCVIAKMSIHHVQELEHVFDEVRDSLKPDGVFMLNEYVGPNRFQWTDDQLNYANQMFGQLPDRIRKAAPVLRIYRPTIKDMLAADPSEAVRSADILHVLRKKFQIIEYKPYGGTILQLVLMHTAALFDMREERDRDQLREMCGTEKQLISQGKLGSDFAYIVAKLYP
jgi:2-polyprenyl-3-methyl-5-hydroxy-6-metoxy-1,4-benzoquinol methylase